MTPMSALLVSILNWQATIRRIIGLNGREVHKTLFGDGTAERPIVFPTACMRSAGVKQDVGKGSSGKQSVSFDASVQFAGVQGSPQLPWPASARSTPARSSSAAVPPSVPWPSSAYPRLPGDGTAERPIVLKQDMGKGSSGKPGISLDASVQSAGMQRSSTEDLGPPSSLISNQQQQRRRNDYPAASVHLTGIQLMTSDSGIDLRPLSPRSAPDLQSPLIELRPLPLRSGGEALEKVEDLMAGLRKQLEASSAELAQERKQQLEQQRTELAKHQKQQRAEFTQQHQQRADLQSPPIELIPLPHRSGPDVVVRLHT
jgi:hypothetical protein